MDCHEAEVRSIACMMYALLTASEHFLVIVQAYYSIWHLPLKRLAIKFVTLTTVLRYVHDHH